MDADDMVERMVLYPSTPIDQQIFTRVPETLEGVVIKIDGIEPTPYTQEIG